MKLNDMGRSALGGVRNHPWRVAVVAVPVVAASVIAGTTMASARPEPTLAVSHSALAANPAPHVLTFADGTTGKKIAAKGTATSIPEPVHIDGCDHNYGAVNQCVPWTVPGSTPQAKCTWLAAHGLGPLVLAGENRQDLPESAEGYICPSNG
jgi:hypothetical protein